MYGGWRPREGNNRSGQSWRPPKPHGSTNCEVPSWEKTFCSKVCRVPWGKICEVKRLINGYQNITDWDDSFSRECFENAKARYWAEINDLKCDIPLPGPNIFNDEVDFYDDFADPKLYDEVGEKPVIPDEDEPEPITPITWDLYNGKDIPVVATGWGDDEADKKPEDNSTVWWGPRPPIEYIEWEDDEYGNTAEQQLPCKGAKNGSAPEKCPAVVTTGWGDAEYGNTANQHHPAKAKGWGNAEHWNTACQQFPVQATGWGDAEPKTTGWGDAEPKTTGWGDAEFNNEMNADSGNAWNQNASWGAWGGETVQNSSCVGGGNQNSWNSGRNDSWNNGRNNAWNNGRDNSWNNGRDNSWNKGGYNSRNNGRDNSWVPSENWSGQQGRRNGRKKNGGNFGSRFSSLRDEANNFQTNNDHRNYGRERNNAAGPVGGQQWRPNITSGR